ncbi:MAG: DegT/DnrJ/EryC1/StrS family aminotransferase [Candidatus Methanosuratincola sp.]|jgi:perosamine synthetase|nr:DegT/DnrJ/EryC1/StrS family aminotransferase [Candidatus Methanosuratincola sp.]
MIPVFRPTVGDEEIAAVSEVLRSGWWGLGPKTKEFETEFAKYVGANYAVGLNSATAALHLALKVIGVEGGEVITTPMTFISTNHAILYNNAIPVFADIEEDTLNIDVRDIERKITPRTKAIMVVHYGGHPCDLDEILALARSKGIKVVEDAAHACGAEYKGKRIGSFSDATCFSFHAVKNLAMGEGGAITVQDENLDRWLRRLRWMGITKSTWDRSEDVSKYSWYYNVEEVGYKYHLSDVAAAIGLAQLRKLERTNARRREIAARYDKGFADLEWLERPVERAYVKSSRHNYVVKVPKRDRFMAYLQEKGIATSVHYIPNHLYAMYKPYYTPLPIAESVWQRLVTLPLFPDLTDEQIDFIIESVRSFHPSRFSHDA